MEQSKATLRKSNPFRSDISWQLILTEGIAALAIGVYALIDEDSARTNLVFLIGLFLLGNGALVAWDLIRTRSTTDQSAPYRLLGAGIGIATGLIVVVDRFSDFIGLNPSRVVVGIGLIGVGVVSLIGLLAARAETPLRVGPVGWAVLLIAWGIVVIYQATNDSNTSGFIGWSAVVIGVLLVALALYRRQRAIAPAVPPVATA